jgi:hypothetical protein
MEGKDNWGILGKNSGIEIENYLLRNVNLHRLTAVVS